MTELPLENPSSVCLDCGSDLKGQYCWECGQPARSPIQPLVAFVREGLEEVLSLSGRVLSGVRDLVIRPGYLTLEYWRGRRTRHLHPIRLFLGSGAVAYFATFLVGPEQSGLLHAVATAVVGEKVGIGWQAITIVLAVILMTAAAQRVVYRRTGRVYVEHLVLVLHTVSFGMLLAPLEAVLLRLLPTGIPGIESMVAPVMVMYWMIVLREVFEDPLALTLFRAGQVAVLATLFLLGGTLVATGLESVLSAILAAL